MDPFPTPSMHPVSAGRRLDLDQAAALLYTRSDRASVLRRLLSSSSALIGGVAGSISMLSSDGARYVKLAERGASCSLGRSFPVDEGATGQVVARRRPVVLDSYHQIPRGHLDSGQAATGAVVAIPMWWRGELVGANVLFAGAARRFTVAEIDDLERLTQLAVPGLAPAADGTTPLAPLIPQRSRSAAAAGRGGARVDRLPGGCTVVRADLPYPAQDRPDTAPAPFTTREQEVLRLLAEGVGDKTIGRRLSISPRTVEKHVGAVLRKTGTASRTAAVVHALDRHWLIGPAASVDDFDAPSGGEFPPCPFGPDGS